MAAALFLATLGLIMVRPRRVPEAASALGGGLLMIAIGAVGPAEAAGLLLGSWNVFLFLLGLMLVSTLADLAGRPEQEIVRYLDRIAADVAVLGALPGGQPGPASIGHVARFVLDHTRCSVLLVRPGAARDV